MRNSLTIYTPVVALYVMMKRGPYKRYYREADPITSMPKRTLYDLRRINREVITNNDVDAIERTNYSRYN